MIAIDLNKKRIRVRPADASLFQNERGTFLELTKFWMNSPALLGSPPFGYDNNTRTIFTSFEWRFERTNTYGEIVRIII